MRAIQVLTEIFLVAVAMAALPTAAATRLQSTWLYLTAEEPRWCAVRTERDARAAVASDAFASGQSAWLRYGPKALDSVIFMTQSEDAYVEDTYRFGAGETLLSVQRRGHYADDPFLTVTFTADKSGRLRLTPQSERSLARQKGEGKETYFVTWPIYRGLKDFPFARLISMKPRFTVSQPCAASLPNGS